VDCAVVEDCEDCEEGRIKSIRACEGHQTSKKRQSAMWLSKVKTILRMVREISEYGIVKVSANFLE